MTFKKVFLNLPADQKTIWTSPFSLRWKDSLWVVPLSGATGLMISSDRHIMELERSNPAAISRSNTIANAGVAGLTALPAAMWAWGSWQGNARERETGLLAGEALANSLVVSETLKVVFARHRPLPVGGQGKFFTDVSDGSFPSMHSTLAWTAASVIAHEYPGTLPQVLMYSAAATVSISRVTGRQHFPSDVVVGGAAGWLIGRQIYRAHHDPELDGGQYGHFIPEGRSFEAEQTGTTYVPMDSWVYQALDRLAAMGYIETAQVGIRPWTRRECARLVEEAGQGIDPDANKWEAEINKRLAAEFAPEIEEQATQPDTRIEEIYARVGGISGQPLADDYHFAKTITYDFGRPFGQGANAVAGGSFRTVVGPLAFYVRGEYQHAGTLPALNGAAQTAIIDLEQLPFAPSQRTATLDRVRPLDAYVSFNFHNNLISFGKQTLWWGPGEDGPFLFSNNAEPLPLLRISRSSPIALPWLFHLLGGLRAEWLLGQLEGQQFVRIPDAGAAPGTLKVVNAPLRPHPFVQGEKISFKPTRNFEFGFGVTVIFSGPGFPLTLGNLKHSYSMGNGNDTSPGVLGADPGDRRSAFDFSYRVPGLRNWLMFYGDSFTEDEYSPVSYPRKSAFRGGLYLPRLPKLSQIDLRAEGVFTDIPNLGAPGVSYFNTHYLSGYTNYGQIIGNAIGREGRGVNIWTTYHFTVDNSLQLHYRNQHVNPEFLGGGYLRDFDATGTFVRAGNLVFSGTVKYEHWNFPLISITPKTNVSAGVQVSWRPVSGWSLRKR